MRWAVGDRAGGELVRCSTRWRAAFSVAASVRHSEERPIASGCAARRIRRSCVAPWTVASKSDQVMVLLLVVVPDQHIGKGKQRAAQALGVAVDFSFTVVVE
uniref:Uncharacterized protein n=1 Tax=Oxyrrhis marina TaxID=2969 RepID=A0A7S3UJ18_OXYMA|mmetsp:Transcript_935/g.1462  ORF Transcript_935/g.1462 Transcript_935/m.1462 type:complete len:102 (+) Transcript_935:176-481(+)